MRPLVAIVALFTSVASGQFPTFKAQEIDRSLKIGYGVIVVDLNADQNPDIVVADKERVIWFENPSWKLRVITEGTTKPDNVCIDAHDIDGDGQLDLALGAGWQPGNTKDASTLQWLRRGKTLEEPWEMYPIAYDEPTLHRMRFADLDGSGRKVLVTVPLQGRGATKEKNWAEAGVKIQLHRIPADPTKREWPAEMIDASLHVPHNFQVRDTGEIIVASYEGVSRLEKGSPWKVTAIGEGNQSNPAGNRGSSEIKQGRLKDGGAFIATIEPWHGHEVVVYARAEGTTDWKRQVIDDQLRWGHAVWCADFDGDKGDEIIAGVRDPLPGKAQSGVRIYRAIDDDGTKWTKSELDPGGVAVEDLAVADLNADGKPDIVAVGRKTGNVKIYWNEGTRRP